MSVKMMFSAMNAETGSPITKLVLIKLADNANEQGECWPSHETISRICEMSVKSSQRHIRKLCDLGLVEVKKRKGPKGNASNFYQLHLPDMATNSPQPPSEGSDSRQVSDRKSPTIASDSRQVSDRKSPTIASDSRPNLSEELSIEPVITESVIETISREKIVSLESLNAFVSYRKKIKKPMTTHAVELLVAKLGGLRVDGYSPQELINEAIMNGWQSVHPKTNAQPNRTFQSHQERMREENMRVMSNWASKE